MLKAVVDTNVWISALLSSSGNSQKILAALRDDRFQAFYPPQLFVELSDVPFRPKLQERIKPEDAHELIETLKARAVLVSITTSPPISRDPRDDDYLACALEADCDFLVTGDKDLLVLQAYERTAIINPARFVEILSG